MHAARDRTRRAGPTALADAPRALVTDTVSAPVSRVSTYAYVNPVVAVALGSLLLNEPIHLTMVIGAAMIVVAVALVVRAESGSGQSADAAEAPPVLPDKSLDVAEEADQRGATRPA